MPTPHKLQELTLWGLFYGCGHRKYTAQRTNDNEVLFEVGATTYRIGLSYKADAYTALVGFDGFFLRHGLARGTVVAAYSYREIASGGPYLGPERVEFQTNPGNLRYPSDYEEEEDRKVWDYYLASSDKYPEKRAYASPWRSRRHFISVPKSRDGTRSLVCQLKPRSLERRYIMIVAGQNEVLFTTCNSY